MGSWYLAPSFAKPEAYASFEELLQPAQQHSEFSCRTWQAEVELEDDDFIHHHTFSTWHQPYVSNEIGIMESSQVDDSDVNYTFIAVWFLFV
jgi:pre-rRNA-processing protein IPI1